MRVTKYDVVFNDDRINSLIKEKGINYCSCDNRLDQPYKVSNLMMDVFNMNKMPEEHLYLICVRTNNSLIGVFDVSHGTVDATWFNPKNIMIRALLCGASNIIIVHNHPSGDPTPSREDISTTKRLQDAGKIIGINLLDHIVIGDQIYYSFKEHEII